MRRALPVLAALAWLAACSTTHTIVGPCIPLDSITVSDSLIVFHKSDCQP